MTEQAVTGESILWDIFQTSFQFVNSSTWVVFRYSFQFEEYICKANRLALVCCFYFLFFFKKRILIKFEIPCHGTQRHI